MAKKKKSEYEMGISNNTSPSLSNRPFASSKIRTQSNCVLNVDDKFYQYNFNNNVELSNFPYFPNRT